ncbi:MAG: nuclear transport factor 2 family protein [Candidatus Eremiobacteraeota bacterium]|nr:nuclear transport factor 2 family protein [Candidatus Eremiobacteraeota bacterium]
MEEHEARARAEKWIASWNSQDVDEILSHYTDDFDMSSPFIARVVEETSGTLRGKRAIGAYWKRGLERAPQLRFELLDVLLGIDSLAIYYRSTVTGKTVVEVLTVHGDKFSSGHAYYSI